MKMTIRDSLLLFVCCILAGQVGFAQAAPDPAPGRPMAPNEQIVRAYYTAFEKKDWDLMTHILADGFTFSSPVDDHISMTRFRERCWPNAYKIKRIDLVKVFVNADNAFVIYNGWTTDGKLFRNSDYFVLKDGKIGSYECFFGRGINYPNSGK